MSRPLYALSKSGISCISPPTLIKYIQEVVHNEPEAQILTMLNKYPVSAYCFEFVIKGGSTIVNADGNLVTLVKDIRKPKAMYYIISPRITETCSIED